MEHFISKTLHGLFEEQVIRTTDSVAVIYKELILSYQELNARANQIASYIRNFYSVTTEDLIVLCLESSEYMLISILGILKAGEAYVPIESHTILLKG